MKKFLLTIHLAATFMIVVNVSYAQEKQVVAAASKTASKVVTPVAKKITAMEATALPNIAGVIQANTVADIISASKNHSTLLEALKSAELAQVLSGAGPFTVFAPTNDAFTKVPKASLDNLLKPESKTLLTKLLTAHVVSGNFKSQDILEAIKTGGGKAIFTTLSGDKITAALENGKIKITDAIGNAINISTADINADNGVIHSIDTVFGAQ